MSRRVDKDMFGLKNFKKAENQHSVIYEASNKKADFSMGISGFSQIEPDIIKDGPYFTPLVELIDVIINKDKQKFNQWVDLNIDINNLIDNHILFLLSCNSNKLASNQYIYRGNTTGNKFKFCPGDYYNIGFGIDNDGKKLEATNICYTTRLFNRLYEEKIYRQNLKSRWSELKKTIINEENINYMGDSCGQKRSTGAPQH